MKGKSNVERQGKESSEKGHHKKKEGEWEKREEDTREEDSANRRTLVDLSPNPKLQQGWEEEAGEVEESRSKSMRR